MREYDCILKLTNYFAFIIPVVNIISLGSITIVGPCRVLMRTSPYKENSRQSIPHASAKQRLRQDQESNDAPPSNSIPRVFQIIKPQHLSSNQHGDESKREFVQCLLVRDVTSGPRERYRLSFQMNSDGGKGKAVVVPAMVAQKESSIGAHYNLFDLSRAGPEAALTKKAGHFIGKLRQDLAGGPRRFGVARSRRGKKSGLGVFATKAQTSSSSTVSYTLFNGTEEKYKLGVFIYDSPGLVTQWRDGQPPRKLRAILANHCNNSGDAAVVPDGWAEQRHAPNTSILELRTKEPFLDAGQYRLNFRGRVTIPSVKNFQLGDDDGNVLLQFGRVSDHKFHLDFRHPFCPATAFAAAITQFDI